jgi:hypothetical protein
MTLQTVSFPLQRRRARSSARDDRLIRVHRPLTTCTTENREPRTHLWAGWLPLMFVALLAVSRRPSWGRAALLGGAFLMNGLTNLHWFAFGSFALILAMPLAAAREQRLLDRHFWGRVAVALSVASILLLPVPLLRRNRGRAEVRWRDSFASGWCGSSDRSADRDFPSGRNREPPSTNMVYVGEGTRGTGNRYRYVAMNRAVTCAASSSSAGIVTRG